MKQDDKALFDLVPEQQSAEARREIMEILLKSIRDIEAQLGSKERTDAAGIKLLPKDYLKWRQGAIRAMNHRTQLYRKYKQLERAANEQAKQEAGGTTPLLAGANFAPCGTTPSDAEDDTNPGGCGGGNPVDILIHYSRKDPIPHIGS